MSSSEIGAEERRGRAQQIIDEYDGLYPPYEAFYIEAIVYAAERAMAAFERFAEKANKGDEDAEIVASVHEALGHAAALSKFFFPSTAVAIRKPGQPI